LSDVKKNSSFLEESEFRVRLTKAISVMEEVQDWINRAEWEKAVSESRKAIDALVQENISGNKTNVDFILHDIMRRCGYPSKQSKAVLNIIKQVRDITHIEHHVKLEDEDIELHQQITREDALFVYINILSFINLVTMKLLKL
jgi:hypothetical protein